MTVRAIYQATDDLRDRSISFTLHKSAHHISAASGPESGCVVSKYHLLVQTSVRLCGNSRFLLAYVEHRNGTRAYKFRTIWVANYRHRSAMWHSIDPNRRAVGASIVSCARPTEIPKTEINIANKMNDDFTALLLNTPQIRSPGLRMSTIRQLKIQRSHLTVV